MKRTLVDPIQDSNKKLRFKDKDDNTYLHLLMIDCDSCISELGAIFETTNIIEIVDGLIKSCIDVNAKNNDGDTPLHLACSEFAEQTIEDEKEEIAVKIVKLLIQNGADVNALNDCLNTPLHLVCSFDIAKILIDNGANINVQNVDEETPLHKIGDYEIAELLVERGANYNIPCNNGWTVLHGTSYDFTNFLICKGVDVNIRDKFGNTPLHLVEDEDTAKLLISNGADINAQNDNGNTPLHAAKTIKIGMCLLNFGADFEIKNARGDLSIKIGGIDVVP
jgi:ankyrin repeat protein